MAMFRNVLNLYLRVRECEENKGEKLSPWLGEN